MLCNMAHISRHRGGYSATFEAGGNSLEHASMLEECEVGTRVDTEVFVDLVHQSICLSSLSPPLVLIPTVRSRGGLFRKNPGTTLSSNLSVMPSKLNFLGNLSLSTRYQILHYNLDISLHCLSRSCMLPNLQQPVVVTQ